MEMSKFRATGSLLKYCLKPRLKPLIITILLVFVFNITELLFPKVLQLYIDAVRGEPLRISFLHKLYSSDYILKLVILPLCVLAIGGLRWLLSYQRTVRQSYLGQEVMRDLRQRIYATVQQLSFSYHDRSHSGTLISNIIDDVRFAAQFLENGIFPLFESLFFIPIAYIVLFWMCWPAAAVSLGLLLLSMIFVYLIYVNGYPFYMVTKDLYARMVQFFSENMEGHQVVRAYGMHKKQKQDYDNIVSLLHKNAFIEGQIGVAATQVMVVATTFGIFAVLGTAIYSARHLDFHLTVGWLLMLYMIQQSIINRVRLLARGLDNSVRFMIATERLERLFGSLQYFQIPNTPSIYKVNFNQLEAKNLGFAYGERALALDNISLEIKRGEMVALVGSTGSGKTTLAHVLCGFYAAKQGSLSLDGLNVTQYSNEEIRRHVAIVFQETFLFSDSVSDNIAYGRPDAAQSEIEEAARLANADAFIRALPKGYATLLGEKGLTLSGGQRQRIGIARALLRQPRLLVLDDSTSALDTETEREILLRLSRQRDRIIVLISHRLPAVLQCDRVYVLDAGQIVEWGKPSELNRPSTAFARILKPELADLR